MTGASANLKTTLLAAVLASCVAATPDDPYSGEGGSMLTEPTASEMADARLILNLERLDAFRPGMSTKREVIAALGRPTWWSTGNTGYSRLGYDFHAAGASVNTPGISPATFVFDSNGVLVDASYPGSYKTWHAERYPFSYAYVKVVAGLDPGEIFLDGIVPAEWLHDAPAGTESIQIGGYVRSKIRVEQILAGHIFQRNMVVEFTVSHMRARPYSIYMLLATDRFGTTRVLDWETGPTLCQADDARAEDEPLKAFLREVRASRACGQ